MTEQGLVPSQETGITLGQQQLDASDLILPRVKLVQQMSDEAQGGKDKKAEPGEWWNTLTQENLGETLDVVPIITFKQRVFLARQERREKADTMLASVGMDPLSEGDGLKCRSFDMIQGIGEPGILCHDCPLSRWVGNTPPLCSETYNVAALTVDGELIILSFAKSSARTGKQFFSMLRLSPAAAWSKVYRVSSKQDKNDQGTFYVAQVAATPERPVPELMKQAEQWAANLGSRRAVDVTPVEEDLEAPREEGAKETDDF